MSAGENTTASFHWAKLEGFFLLPFVEEDFRRESLLRGVHHPGVQFQVDNVHAVIHFGGGAGEDQELMVEGVGGAVLWDELVIDCQGLGFVARVQVMGFVIWCEKGVGWRLGLSVRWVMYNGVVLFCVGFVVDIEQQRLAW